MTLLPLILMSPILAAAAYHDMRYMRIPNILSLLALGLFVATLPLLPVGEIGARLLAAALVFAFGIVVFALRLFGGGDVKLMAVLMLFIPSQSHAIFAFGFSAAMLIGVAFIMTLRAAPWLSSSDWITIRQRGTFPMGISIAAAGIMHPFLTTVFS